MRISITYWWLCACLLTGFSTEAQQGALGRANALRASGNNVVAATAYERAYFFADSDSVRVSAIIGRAECQKASGDYYEAYKGLVRATRYEMTDSMRCAVNYAIAFDLYMAGYFADAATWCEKAFSIPVSTDESVSSQLVHAFCANELGRYPMAAGSFRAYAMQSKFSQEKRDSLNHFVTRLYAPDELPRLKSLRKARRLSKVLPGAGLFYAGKPGKALTNIGFLLLSAGYTAANIYFMNYVTSASAGLYLLRSFYTGGVNQLNDVIPERNERRMRAFSDKVRIGVISIIENNGL